MCRDSLVTCLTAGIVLFSPTPGRADKQNAEETFKAKGLRKVSTYFVLSEESEAGKAIRTLAPLQKQLRDAQRELAQWENRDKEKKRLIVTYLQKRRQLRAQLERTTSVSVHNRLVSTLNELGDRINLMQQDEEGKQALQEARGAANRVREEYIGRLLEARQLCDKVKKRYQELAEDDAVIRAIGEYNEASGKRYRLGPSSGFLSSDRRLKKYQAAVMSEKIDLRRGGGNLWYVPVVLNNGHVQEMAIDTGASLISIPWKVAEAAGMAPTENDPTIRVGVADGREVPAKQVLAKKVRVGKFIIEDVPCVVMPQELAESPCLLGLSFMGHFTFKIDSTEGKLLMSQVKTPDAGRRGRGSRRRK